MANKKQSKRQRDIKSKLVAAICMLLVSSIMMVSSTYAWFTLSTAPEVTGINTAVGANGNLEMALLPKDGLVGSITSNAGDSVKDIEEKNVTWGNLVDLKDSSIYGLNQITLYPAALNLTADGKIDVKGFILETPKYGADGRVSELVANAQTGYFNKQTKNFTPNTEYGVRAVGSASGMTDRQLSYRNARSAANTATALAANLASASLNNNGSSLANIAIEYGMGADTASFDKTDVESLRAIINDLNGKDGILDQIETAYMQYILGYAASAASGEADTVWQAVDGAVSADGATLASVITAIGESNVPEAVMTGINKYNTTVTSVTTADTKLQALEARLADTDTTNDTFTWAEIREAMEPLADPAAMEINGFKASEVKDNLGDLVSSVTEQGGLRVIMKTGAGVYADIADQSGDYTASVTIERVEYNNIVLNNMKARMETASTVKPSYLTAVGAAVEAAKAPASAGGTVLPISDMYGYIIDLAFRTNAAESKLLLQKKAADRIYSDNTNEDTMGHGSSMTFMATTTDFGNDQVKGLMDAIKIVFFDPSTGTIYCYAGLDTANATTGAEGVTAEMYLYNYTEEKTEYTQEDYAEGSTKEYYTRAEASRTYTEVENPVEADLSKYYVANDQAEGGYALATSFDENTTYYTLTITYTYTKVDATAAAGAASGTLYVKTVTPATKETITDNAIMALTQNTGTALSVLVYLDGNLVDNGDVAATGSTSMTGTMNLQFASSANLVPMEYADLYIPGATEAPSTGATEAPTEASTEAPTTGT